MTLYEALFLMDPDAKPEPSHEEYLLDLLKKNGANVTTVERWGERKLTYEIKRKKRGLYFLVHFEAAGPAIVEIRRASAISEFILRDMVLVDEDNAIAALKAARVESVLGGVGAPAGGEAAAHG